MSHLEVPDLATAALAGLGAVAAAAAAAPPERRNEAADAVTVDIFTNYWRGLPGQPRATGRRVTAEEANSLQVLNVVLKLYGRRLELALAKGGG